MPRSWLAAQRLALGRGHRSSAPREIFCAILNSANLTSEKTSAECCLGTMTWGGQNSEAEAHEQLSFAWDAGINFMDAAEMCARACGAPHFHVSPGSAPECPRGLAAAQALLRLGADRAGASAARFARRYPVPTTEETYGLTERCHAGPGWPRCLWHNCPLLAFCAHVSESGFDRAVHRCRPTGSRFELAVKFRLAAGTLARG